MSVSALFFDKQTIQKMADGTSTPGAKNTSSEGALET